MESTLLSLKFRPGSHIKIQKSNKITAKLVSLHVFSTVTLGEIHLGDVNNASWIRGRAIGLQLRAKKGESGGESDLPFARALNSL